MFYVQFSNKPFLHVCAGCEGYCHSLHPQRHPLHWRNPSSFPTLLTAGLQATQRQPCGDDRLVSIDHTDCRFTELNLEFQLSAFIRSSIFLNHYMTFISYAIFYLFYMQRLYYTKYITVQSLGPVRLILFREACIKLIKSHRKDMYKVTKE